ncbi:MAG TPA: flagellar motor protein MotB [Acetobacteraceae bacterium]|nr:flagellar motor protein MotB [Acetobacteraceae bacterium]
MSGENDAKRPIVIKRAAEERNEHSGQWKVAYADFVTAMMAFFLIMWLLSSTTESQRKGIAKFFNTASILDMSGGNGALDGGKSILNGADPKIEKIIDSSEDGGPSVQQDNASAENDADPEGLFKDPQERQRFEAVKAEVEHMIAQGELKDVAGNLSVEMTPEGLRLQIFDRDDQGMFQPGSAVPTPRLMRILGVIGQVLATVQNSIIITGHTDGQALNHGAYSNWELSADRANAARRELESKGVSADRMLKIEGRAATDLLVPQTPDDPRNRRIAVTILRSDAADALSEHAQTPGQK